MRAAAVHLTFLTENLPLLDTGIVPTLTML